MAHCSKLLLLVLFCLNPLLSELTLEEKVGQLFMIGLFLDQPKEEIAPYICDFHVGHVLIQGKYWEPEQEKAAITYIQSLSKTPLTIAQDLEWGLSQRLKNVVVFPRNMTLGALSSDDLIYEMGKEVARECVSLGVNFNLSPVADVNINPLNPVIHLRSFGDNPHTVAKKCVQMMKGLKAGGLKTCAKHFPGHGNTAQDSHLTLPRADKPLEELQKCELIPFYALDEAGVDAIMTSHILNRELDPDHPATLSKNTLQLIPDNVLILSDDLLMKAIQGDYAEIALKAYKAQVDIMLFTDHQPHSREAFKRAYTALLEGFKKGELDLAALDKKVDKILAFKKNLGSATDQSVTDAQAFELKDKLFMEAVTRFNDYPLSEPIQIVRSPKEAIWGNTLIYSGSPYDIPKLPQDRAIILVYEEEGIPYGLKAIETNRFPGKLPISAFQSTD